MHLLQRIHIDVDVDEWDLRSRVHATSSKAIARISIASCSANVTARAIHARDTGATGAVITVDVIVPIMIIMSSRWLSVHAWVHTLIFSDVCSTACVKIAVLELGRDLSSGASDCHQTG